MTTRSGAILRAWLAAMLCCGVATSADALDLRLGNDAENTMATTDPAAPFEIPVGPAPRGTAPDARTLVGTRTRVAWRIPGQETDFGAVLNSVREQLENAGYDILYICETRDCGGFDFRLALPVLPMPAMFVDLGSFTYLAAERTPDTGTPVALLSLLLSAAPGEIYVQQTEISMSRGTVPATPSAATDQLTSAPASSVADRLTQKGHAVLDGLAFDTGSTELSDSQDAPLRAVADFLNQDRKRRIAIVGHSDWVGSLGGNITVSRERATAVAAYLTEELDVSPDQIEIEGVGYLAPRATNDSAEGRTANRRVEVVVLPPAS